MRSVVLFLVVSLFSVAPPAAHPATEIGFFADAEGLAGTLEMPIATPIDVYVLAFGVSDLFAVEFGYAGSLLDDPGVIFLRQSLLGNPFCIDSCCWQNTCIWGTGGCLTLDPEAPVVLARFTLFAAAPLPDDLSLCVTGADPSSFPDGSPGYGTCANEAVAFGLAPNPCGRAIADGCLLVNPSVDCDVVADARSSFGAVKSLFRN